MELVQTISKEISSVANNTAAVVNNSNHCFSSSLTSPKQSKFSSVPKDSHNSNVSNCTMLFNPVRATRQAHRMQQDILPESTTSNMSTPINFKAQFLSVGNALCYGGRVFSDFKAFAIHRVFQTSRLLQSISLSTAAAHGFTRFWPLPNILWRLPKLLELNLHSL